MGFKTETQAENVIIFIIFIMFIIFIFFLLQTRVDLCLADNVWQDKCADIAQTGDNLGDQFCPAMRTGRRSYIQQGYLDGAAVSNGPAHG